MSFLQNLKYYFEKRTARKQLQMALTDYPSYYKPHPGPSETLSPDQAKANLQALLAQKTQRIQIVSEWLCHAGLDPKNFNLQDSPKQYFDALDAWALATWINIPDAIGLTEEKRWLYSNYQKDDIFYSLLIDIALLLGDIVCQYKPSCTWDIDFSIKSPDASDAFQRPVLRGMAIPDNPAVAANYDIELHVFAAFERIVKGPIPEVHGLTRRADAMIDRYPEIAKLR